MKLFLPLLAAVLIRLLLHPRVSPDLGILGVNTRTPVQWMIC